MEELEEKITRNDLNINSIHSYKTKEDLEDEIKK